VVAVAITSDGARLTLRTVRAVQIMAGDCLPYAPTDQIVCEVRPVGARIACVMGDGTELTFAPRDTVQVARSRKHRADCAHCVRIRDFAMQYRLAREAAEVAREGVTGGYATEVGLHAPIITFKQWLKGMAQ